MKNRIKEIRATTKMSQETFGGRLGVTKSSVSLLESGKNSPSEQTIKLICTEFNVNERWLRTGEGEMFEQLTDQQKIMKYTAMILKDTDSVVANAIKAFIVTYEQLDDVSKKVLEDTALKFLNNAKKGR